MRWSLAFFWITCQNRRRKLLKFERSPVKLFFSLGHSLGEASKIYYSTVKPFTPPPPLPLLSAFCDFFGVFYLLLWLYVFWKGFYTRKCQFSCYFWNPQFLRIIICKRPAPPDHHLKQASPSFWQTRKWHENAFLRPLTMCFEYQRIKFQC